LRLWKQTTNNAGVFMNEAMKVWFLSPEVEPFAKTGGLADVAGSLPRALHSLGVDVRVGLPYYRVIKDRNIPATQTVNGMEIPLGDLMLPCKVLETRTKEGIPVYLFEREDLFDRPQLYGNADGDYYDNLERFSFFCRGAILFAKRTGFSFDVVHCHDWQTGLVPAYIKSVYRNDPFFSNAASVFTIHNIGYQGLFPRAKLDVCGIPSWEFHPDGIEYWGNISLLKAGLVYSDVLTTVSPRHGEEIQTPEFGRGMEGVLKKRVRDLHGILNGADYSVWDPAGDSHIPVLYGPGTMEGKKKDKLALVEEMGLTPSLMARPVLGMISRLSSQKGCGLLAEILEKLMKLGVGLVILGAGEEKYETILVRLAERHRGSMAVRIGFDDPLAHRIMAGADMLLVPSQYEPCGLTQMYALRYGTVPVVRATGGLDDTIVEFDPVENKGNGFKFGPYEAAPFLRAIRRAMGVFKDRESWRRLMQNGMKEDFSWDRSARQYLEIYESLVRTKRRGEDR
jgi:starch synthase